MIIKKLKTLFAIATVTLLGLAGCSKNSMAEPLTAKEFKTAMEEQGFAVTDKPDAAADGTYQQILI